MTCLCRAGRSSRTWLQKAGSCALAYMSTRNTSCMICCVAFASPGHPIESLFPGTSGRRGGKRKRNWTQRICMEHFFIFLYEKYSIFVRLKEESSCSLNPVYLTGLPTDSKCLFTQSVGTAIFFSLKKSPLIFLRIYLHMGSRLSLMGKKTAHFCPLPTLCKFTTAKPVCTLTLYLLSRFLFWSPSFP